MATKKNGNGNGTCQNSKCTNGNGKKVQECTNKRQALSQLRRKKWTTFKFLNEKQKEAVLSLDGPLLIVAGAGSGKTKVLISRIAHIIENKKAYPNQILAVTFTNKAAKEMQNRVCLLYTSDAADE